MSCNDFQPIPASLSIDLNAQGVSRLYGAVLVTNVIASAVALVVLGFKVVHNWSSTREISPLTKLLQVGGARKKFTAKALKDGDAHAEQRFSYPTMYAGTQQSKMDSLRTK